MQIKNKLIRFSITSGLIASMVSVSGVGIASAATLTFDATSVVSDGVLTLNGAAANALNLGTTNTSGVITIGHVSASVGNVVINGGITGGANTLFDNVTTSTISIGVANTGGITIGNGATIKTISIGAGNAVNTIKIGDNASPANVITIGGALSTTTVGSLKNTIGVAGVANGNGVRIGNGRVTVNKPTAAVVVGDAAIIATVTQILDAGIFTVAASINRAFTLPTAATVSGLVQALPGTPAVGDVFSFYIVNTGASTVTVTAGTGATIAGNAVMPATSNKLVLCRVTAVTADSETITCY